jgi:hypothetical protein
MPDNNDINMMAPPLDMDLASVDTSLPLLKDGEYYHFVIEKAELKKTNDGKGRFISIDMKTTMPASDIKGQPLGPGVHVFDNQNVVPTGKATWDMIQRNVGAFVQSIEGGVPGARLSTVDQWVPTLPGRTLKAKIGYVPEGVSKKDGKAYKAKNEVLLYVKA